jgi:hypothetical protein
MEMGGLQGFPSSPMVGPNFQWAAVVHRSDVVSVLSTEGAMHATFLYIVV